MIYILNVCIHFIMEKPYHCLIILLLRGVVTEDPCTNYKTFSKTTIGSRNEKCPIANAPPICDYNLEEGEGWYSLDGGALLNYCPTSGNCGVSYPGWMNGTLPSSSEGVVHRNVCIKFPTDCCKETVQIKVKECRGFHVYYLKNFDFCPSVYCIETPEPCERKTTTTAKATPVSDPCKVHSVLETRDFGSRNERCQPPGHPLCDYYLLDDWYVVHDGVLLSHCPSGNCGVGYPAWLNGTLPNVAEGIVDRKACIKYPSNCCKETLNVKIKNCGQFYVYKLPPVDGCPSGYCFESSLPCFPPTTTVTKGSDNTHGPENSEISNTILIAILVITGLVLAVVLAFGAGYASKRKCKTAQTAQAGDAVQAWKKAPRGGTITSSEIRVPSAPVNTPAISPPSYKESQSTYY